MTALSGPILFNSSTGSDTAASGLGPASAVTGSSAELDGTSTVDVSYDGMDLSGISAGNLLFCDTASGRKFSVIASVDTLNETITTDDAWGTESGVSWAVGGKRQQLFNPSYTQFATDMVAGFTISLASGHTETHTSATPLFNCGDVSSARTRIIGEDPDNKPLFIDNSNIFNYAFQFSGSIGLVIENCHFRTTGRHQKCVFSPAVNMLMIDCDFDTTIGTYSTYGIVSGHYAHSNRATFVGCTMAKIGTKENAYAGNGRAYSFINCKGYNTTMGFYSQSYSGYVSYFLNNQVDCDDLGIGVDHQYTYISVITGNIIRVADGGTAIYQRTGLATGNNIYPSLISNNIITGSGTYTAIELLANISSQTRFRQVYAYNNAIHGGSVTSIDPYDDQVAGSITTDPQVTGDLSSGDFTVGSQAVIDHVGVTDKSTSVTPDPPTESGTQFYPFRHLLEAPAKGDPDFIPHPLRGN